MSKFKPIIGPHNHPLSLDSGNSVRQFIRAAAVDFHRPAIGITDHGTIGAIIEAHEYAKELKKKENVNITVIPGIEFYLLPDDDSGLSYYHITAHFKDFPAYLEACKISKSSFDRGIFKGGELKPLITWQELESLSGKVTLFSSCLVGAVMRPWMTNRKDISEKNFVRLMNIAGDGHFFTEIFPYEVSKDWDRKTKTFKPIKPLECCTTGKLQVDANNWVIALANKYNIPIVLSEDAHYAHEKDKFIQDSRLNRDGQDNWKMSDANCLHHSDWLYGEMSRLHPEFINEKTFNELVDNSYKFLENFKGLEPSFKPSLPKIIIDNKEITTDKDLVAAVLQLIIKKNRFDLKNPIYLERLKKEIQQLAFNGKVNILPYFLTLNTIVDFCESNEILVGPGRGSAAGSLLSYGLGITSVDPIEEDLSFERFFDVTRVEEGLADIDMDFSNREAVVDFIKQKWGDNFAFLGIGTTFKTKSALKDIDRFLHGSVRQITEDVCKTIPQSPQGINEEDFLNGYADADGISHLGQIETNEKLKTYLQDNPKAEEFLFKMVGIVRQMGRHAAGVLIADKPIHDFIPIMKVSGEPTTQLLPKWVEKCGGVKYDILGLNTLEDIRFCLKLIEQHHGIKIDPWKIEDSKDFWEAGIKEPATIFQLHTDTVRKGLQTMRPHSVQEAAILTSVFRPGATDAISDEDSSKNMAEIFIERWIGAREVVYVNKDVEAILAPTKSVIVYQEQIMKIVHDLGGLSMPETNQLRKAISKKTGDALIKLLHKVKDNLITKGWTEHQAETIVNQMKASGRYCFNKSHAVSYCYIARACAYLKYKYPIEWWTSVLTNASKEDLQTYWSKMSDIILLPDINSSTDKFQIIKKDNKSYILSPLNLIERVGPSVISEILKIRPISSLEDFMNRVDRRVVNKGPMMKMILSGVLNQFFTPDLQDYEKIQAYLTIKAKLEGKKTQEALPQEYISMTPLKNFLLKKSVFKVYNENLREIAFPKLLSMEVITKSAKNSTAYMYHGLDKKQNIQLVSLKLFENLIESSHTYTVAIIAFIVDTEEKMYDNNSKTRLIVTAEIDNRVFNFIKWPNWGTTRHGIDEDISESVCVLTLSKRKVGGEFFIDKIDILENLNFLKEKKDESGESKKPTRRIRKTIKANSEGSDQLGSKN